MEWEKSLSVEVKEIDDQHKKLIDIMNELTMSLNKEEGSDAYKKILDELVKYSEYHFETEEKYFDKFNYELSEEHKKEHKDFKNKVKEFVRKFETNKNRLSIEILEFLGDWIRDHLKDTDKKYIECFHEHGLR